jgi:hypothetical protein
MAAVALDLGYDRIQGQNGFSMQGAAIVPVFRFPRPMKDPKKNYLRIYAEPGVGRRWGAGQFGGYTSAKVMVALFSDQRLMQEPRSHRFFSPFIEFQRRFPFNSPLQGDNSLAFGMAFAFCSECD